MKNICLLIFILLIAVPTFAQTDNDRLNELETEIKAAADAGDYDLAASLKKEKELRLEIKKAADEGDYDKAAKLKKQLAKMPTNQQSRIKALEAEQKKAVEDEDYEKAAELKKEIKALKSGKPIPEKEEEEEEEEVVETNDNDITRDGDIERDEYVLKHGFFIDGLIQGGNYTISSVNTGSPLSIPMSSFGLGLRIGNKWYFGRGKVFRPGISAIWSRFNFIVATSSPFAPQGNTGINTAFAWAPINIGYINAFSFGGKLGLEININFGLNTIFDFGIAGSSDPEFVLGYLINPTIKFRYKSFAVGIDVTYMSGTYLSTVSTSSSAYLNGSNLLIGLTIGGKF